MGQYIVHRTTQYTGHKIGHGDDVICHHGVKGMKWGVRKQQRFEKKRDKTVRRINTMYDYSNKWTTRKIKKLDAKGKTNKANVMREMRDRNEKARKEQTSTISKMNMEQFKKARRTALADWAFGGQSWMQRNQALQMTVLNRLSEYGAQRGMRWMSNFTLNRTLGRMNQSDGYRYLDRKNIAITNYNVGFNDAPKTNS